MASRAAARSGANSSRVELTNTRTRWSGVRITVGIVGGCVSIVNQALSRKRAFASMKHLSGKWEIRNKYTRKQERGQTRSPASYEAAPMCYRFRTCDLAT